MPEQPQSPRPVPTFSGSERNRSLSSRPIRRALRLLPAGSPALPRYVLPDHRRAPAGGFLDEFVESFLTLFVKPDYLPGAHPSNPVRPAQRDDLEPRGAFALYDHRRLPERAPPRPRRLRQAPRALLREKHDRDRPAIVLRRRPRPRLRLVQRLCGALSRRASRSRRLEEPQGALRLGRRPARRAAPSDDRVLCIHVCWRKPRSGRPIDHQPVLANGCGTIATASAEPAGPEEKSAVLSGGWSPAHSAYRITRAFVEALEGYHLTFVPLPATARASTELVR